MLFCLILASSLPQNGENVTDQSMDSSTTASSFPPMGEEDSSGIGGGALFAIILTGLILTLAVPGVIIYIYCCRGQRTVNPEDVEGKYATESPEPDPGVFSDDNFSVSSPGVSRPGSSSTIGGFRPRTALTRHASVETNDDSGIRESRTSSDASTAKKPLKPIAEQNGHAVNHIGENNNVPLEHLPTEPPKPTFLPPLKSTSILDKQLPPLRFGPKAPDGTPIGPDEAMNLNVDGHKLGHMLYW